MSSVLKNVNKWNEIIICPRGKGACMPRWGLECCRDFGTWALCRYLWAAIIKLFHIFSCDMRREHLPFCRPYLDKAVNSLYSSHWFHSGSRRSGSPSDRVLKSSASTESSKGYLLLSPGVPAPGAGLCRPPHTRPPPGQEDRIRWNKTEDGPTSLLEETTRWVKWYGSLMTLKWRL